MHTSAMPNAGNAAAGIEPERRARLEERAEAVGVDRLGAVEADPQPGQVEVLGAAQATGWRARS